MPRNYIDNPWIQHYLEELDKAIDAYMAARNRGDWKGIGAALKEIKKVEEWIENRTRKINEGNGNTSNGSAGWNPPGTPEKGKKTPAAVRAEEA